MNIIDAIAMQMQSFNSEFNNLKENSSEIFFRPFIFADYLVSAIVYGASASDYFNFDFYNKKHNAKNKFLCYRLKKKLFHTFNDYSKRDIFDNKVNFLNTFSQFAKREWIDVGNSSLEEFFIFCKKHPIIIVKPKDQSGGKGIKKIFTDNVKINEIYSTLHQTNQLAEEMVFQHSSLSALYPNSLNTVRVVTLVVNGKMNILATAFRCGRGDSITDNMGSGGLAIKVENETGILVSNARGHGQKMFIRHPDTGLMFHGFKIPYWDKVIRMLENATKIVPGVGYIGWDVAITENDVLLIEGNFEGMIHLIQRPADQGIKKDVENILLQIKNI